MNLFLKVYDLLHGMMLPSGNDAAYCIAENTGALIN
jgi:D-alanyl-D-alanine carboxypeptidase